MRCWLLGVGGLEKLEIKVDRIILLEYSMTILKNIKKPSSIILSFCKYAKASMIAMARP